MEPRQYQEWLSGRPMGVVDVIAEDQTPASTMPQSMARSGETLFQTLGCNTCHQLTGRGIGPSLVGLLGKTVELENGQTVTADIQYIRDSILDPHAQIVAGYRAIMPTYDGQISEEELLQLVEYIAALREGSDISPPGTSP
ncbi:MAG: cytochrome c [Caldilineaceae bacterium]